MTHNVLHWRSTGNSLLVMPGQRAYIENENYKLTKRSIGEVMPKTKADSELQLMFAGLAPFFANALLAAVIFSECLKSLLFQALP